MTGRRDDCPLWCLGHLPFEGDEVSHARHVGVHGMDTVADVDHKGRPMLFLPRGTGDPVMGDELLYALESILRAAAMAAPFELGCALANAMGGRA